MSTQALFATRLTIASAGTPFLDGFSTASAAFLLAMIEGFTPITTALFTSLYLAGTFVGAAVLGPIADKVGRRLPFVLSMVLVCLVLCLTIIVPSLGCLLIMRLVTGLFLGGDYPVGQALVSESLAGPAKARALSHLMLAWYIGAMFALFAVIPAHLEWSSWQSILAIQALIAAILILLRIRCPESPLWLTREQPINDAQKTSHTKILASTKNRRALFFCIGFWICQTIPATIMMLYSPVILADLTNTNNAWVHMLTLYGFFFVGVLPSSGQWFATHAKKVLLVTFFLMGVGLALVAIFPKQEVVCIIGFALFAVAYGLQSPLDFIYPNRLFETSVRSTLVGITTAASRLGAMGAAFTFPLLHQWIPIEILMMMGIIVISLGIILGAWLAPKDRTF